MILSDAEVAVAAAEAGAAVVRRYYGGPVEHHAKSHRDFATTADLEAERAILAVIRAHRPDDGFLGEEGGHSGPDGDRLWLVDPLCGTLNFAVTTPLVAVNVALRTAAAEVTAAASADPLAGELFWTDGTGAWLRRNGLDSPLRPSGESLLVDVNLDPPFPNSALFRATTLLADPEFIEGFGPRVLSTTLAVAWVAAGRRAAYVTDGHFADSVHFAAGLAICRAAGAVVTGIHGQPLHTGIGGLLIAADAATHAELLRLVRKQG
ncbi:phosphatase [Asanoa ishikariensis]|uniref:Myo-inositol-1(Or 4)-monophosphatase n=1 Tax=Asanoa ishikariensis TaxID=137265 RepID=A0A1H3R5V5_9ACTN|nr:inositol monophosphatase family protein [Asanoa ishikariensis]GIF64442.1 phosphatase [Asanoa ishikariensis]SDZ20339.1 myo-inositol-1(or 4)-monophosphatase [Asanoa ishikariensis]